MYISGIPTGKGDLSRHWHPPIGRCLPCSSWVGYCDAHVFQAAKDVSTSQEALVNLFERIEAFFKRLESYAEVPPTTTMTSVIIKIMVEVLTILGIATKEIKQGRASEFVLTIYIVLSSRLFRKIFQEADWKESG
jgi:hypothetical protein